MALELDELKQTIKAIRDTELALGNPIKKVLEDEKENRMKLRKSIVTITDIRKNTIIKRNMIAIKRPGSGISPSEINNIVGKKAKHDLSEDYVLSFDDFK